MSIRPSGTRPRCTDGNGPTATPTCWLSSQVAAATRSPWEAAVVPPAEAQEAITTTVAAISPIAAAQAAAAIAAMSVARRPYGAG